VRRVIVTYKRLCWSWWVPPMFAVADWSHSNRVAGWAIRIAYKYGRRWVVEP
jgi:hypothetical protein